MHFIIFLFTMIIEELIAVKCFFAYVVVVNRICSADELFLPTITCLSISGWVPKQAPTHSFFTRLFASGPIRIGQGSFELMWSGTPARSESPLTTTTSDPSPENCPMTTSFWSCQQYSYNVAKDLLFCWGKSLLRAL